jgi:hypothetical protein
MEANLFNKKLQIGTLLNAYEFSSKITEKIDGLEKVFRNSVFSRDAQILKARKHFTCIIQFYH